MKITAIELENVKGFQLLAKTELSHQLNVLIGANNAGKSTILSAIFMLQNNALGTEDISIGKTNGQIKLHYDERSGNLYPDKLGVIEFDLKGKIQPRKVAKNGALHNYVRFNNVEPNNLIYPYLSKRKTTSYNETINEENTNAVSGNFANLYSKIDRLIAPQYLPGNKLYLAACKNVLGFEISTLAKGNGKKAVYYIHNSEHISLTAMGEGVTNIIGLITDLCVAENKIFLIEEPENDIHPKALKALMELVIEKSQTNQFFVSTHSNIVMKYLGSVEGSKVFNVTNDKSDRHRPNLFVSQMEEIPDNPEDRRKVLEDLGYDFFDFDLWRGWLFLEESSAETIIRDYLIEWFVAPLKGKIRTFSAGGVSNIELKFEDFNRLFVFLHLQPSYKNRVWVLIDGGNNERKIIQEMRDKYAKAGWSKGNFNQLEQHDFEKYYPTEFQPKVNKVLKISDRKTKREEKRKLLIEVVDWIESDKARAKKAFEISAAQVIKFLKSISKKI